MIFCKTVQEKVSKRNRRLWILILQVNELHDAVFRFGEEDKREDYLRVKKHLLERLNLD